MGITVPFFISHQGCPHQCVFCDQERITGSGGRLPDRAEILAKISKYSRSAGGRPVQVAFFGGTFTALPRHVQEGLLKPLRPLLDSGEVYSVRVSTRPDSVDGDTARFLHGNGVEVVELGIQSMADDVLEASGRGHTVAQVEQAIQALQQVGILWGAQLMPGLPADTPVKALDSLERIIRLSPYCLRIYPTLVIRGTPLAALLANGSYEPLSLDGAVRLCMAMLHRTWQANVPVIRMGLHPTADLETTGAILAGPYHPAFRYLVESELCYYLLEALVDGFACGSAAGITCAPGRISTIIGHRRSNVRRLEGRYGVLISDVQADAALTPFQIIVKAGGQLFPGHLVDGLNPREFLCFA